MGHSLRRRVAAGLAVVLGSVALSSCDFDVYQLPLPGGTDTGEDPFEVTVEFRDVLDLVPQSNVKVSDVNVGKVTEVELDGYRASVTLELARDTELPENALAEIRQTSLLGEKFVSLEPPATGASQERLGDGDTIPLERTGRNPEVEEVLGAMSLLLNGGGVAQLKTIATELNNALEGREDSARSVLTQVDVLTEQLDTNRAAIVDAIESVNRLAVSARRQQDSIDAALEELPSALDSIDRQRDDLVRMLGALNRLGDVGVRVIRASKESTVGSVRQLQPVLTELANSGDALVDSFHVFLTYPFVDEVVGRDPQVARNLHMGDYTNLSIRLELDLSKPILPGLPCTTLTNLPGGVDLTNLLNLPSLCQGVSDALTSCVNTQDEDECAALPDRLLNSLCKTELLPILCQLADLDLGNPGGNLGNGGNPGGPANNGGLGGLGGLGNLGNGGLGNLGPDLQDTIGGLLGGLGLGGRGRPGFDPGSGAAAERRSPTMEQLMESHDPGLVGVLVAPMAVTP